MISFEEKIKGSVPTLVLFYKASEPESVKLESLVNDLREEFSGKANIIYIDDTHNGVHKTKYRLHEYPTWILFKEGEELMRESGDKPKSKLEEMIVRAF